MKPPDGSRYKVICDLTDRFKTGNVAQKILVVGDKIFGISRNSASGSVNSQQFRVRGDGSDFRILSKFNAVNITLNLNQEIHGIGVALFLK